MVKKIIISFLLPFLVVQVGYTQQAQPLWIVPLSEEIINETDLCERCNWLPPTITQIEFNDENFYFLRYACSLSDNFARMYDQNGNIVGECMTVNGDSNCGFGFNAFTIYTLAEITVPIWNCQTGFDCDFSRAINVEQYVPITVDDSRCAEGIKILKVSEEYNTYKWSGQGIDATTSAIEIRQGGTYQVEVTDMNDCPITGSVFISEIDALNVAIKGPAKVCPDGAINLLTTTYESYEWSSGQSNNSITVGEAGTYSVTVTNEQDCEGSASFIVEEHQLLDLEIRADALKVKEGEEVNIELQIGIEESRIVEQEWTGNGIFSCDDCHNTTFRPVASGNVEMTMLDSRGCITVIQQFIEVEELPLEIYTPNIFAPSGSGVNTAFTIFGGTNVLEIEELVIFDRWGNLVFDNANFLPNQPNIGWDGTSNGQLVAQDVYVFVAKVLFSNGISKRFSGDVLVIN